MRLLASRRSLEGTKHTDLFCRIPWPSRFRGSSVHAYFPANRSFMNDSISPIHFAAFGPLWASR
jgi:hypothetical protein